MIFGKKYKKIEFDDIERLVENKISESKILDYKRDLNLDKGDEKKEFLYDIASFANSDGGIIIYGVSEQKDEKGNNTGLPDEIFGINIENFDKLLLKVEELIKSSIEPNIPDIVIRFLEKGNVKILIIGIVKPIGLPRMVTYNSSNKFYKRRNSGKYLVDVYELNQLFMSNIELTKQIELFRDDRISKIRNLKYLPNIEAKNFTLIHLVPLSYFTYNLIALNNESILNEIKLDLRPIGAPGWDSRHNYEGYLIFHAENRINITTYNQLFRNGVVEFFTHEFHSNNENNKFFHIGYFETDIIEAIDKGIKLYKKLNIPPPFVIQISIFDLLHRFADVEGHRRLRTLSFTVDEILLPNAILNDYDESIERNLRTIFDIVWQSAGYFGSPNYNENGERQK
jgi:hypothetical protein